MFVGTTTAWTTPEAMETDEEHGSHFFFMALGQTCVESFRLMLGSDSQHSFYPGTHKANESAQVFGPDDLNEGRYWTIDGRADGMPAGTVYQITFEWGEGMKRVWWMPTEEPTEIVNEIADHQYYCMGSFNEWSMQRMRPVVGKADTIAISFPIGAHLVEEFQLIRDKDTQQVFYPHEASGVCGPDEMGHDTLAPKFVVRGNQFDSIAVQFTLKDGSFTVTANDPAGETTWSSHSKYVHP